MSYISPVDLIVSEMNLRMEGEIFKAVQNVGVNVDRDELIKALQYDRDQYQKGYADRDAEIVRCKDCKHVECEGVKGFLVCDLSGFSHSPEFFCADGERRK